MKPSSSLCSLWLVWGSSGIAATTAFAPPPCSSARSSAFLSSPTASSRSRYPLSFPDVARSNHNNLDKILSIRVESGASSSASSSSTRVQMIGPALASILAGSAAGAVGVGVAFPLDTLKTKSQVMSQALMESERLNKGQGSSALASSSVSTAAVVPAGGADGNSSKGGLVNPSQLGMIGLMVLIWQSEGLAGFFGGVRAMMAGQAVIKAVAFSANSFALDVLQQDHTATATLAITTSVVTLIAAAAFSGFVTSFLVAPVERIKVMMQASGSSLYKNEIECIKAVVEKEGVEGLFGRGLGPTLAREVPSYAIYFVVYGLLMQTAVASTLGGAAPLVFGAMSGCACWIPVYPIDVVKTLVQNTEGGGGEDKNTWEVAKDLYNEGGVGAFFDGLTPKMLRAAVNHSVTFYLYDLAMHALISGNTAT